jgi:hypothetical protein
MKYSEQKTRPSGGCRSPKASELRSRAAEKIVRLLSGEDKKEYRDNKKFLEFFNMSGEDKIDFLKQKLYRLYDQKLKSWFYMHHADLYFKNKNIEYIHYPAIAGELLACKPDFINIDKMYHEGVSWIDTTGDNHPGIESNKETAERIYKILNV